MSYTPFNVNGTRDWVVETVDRAYKIATDPDYFWSNQPEYVLVELEQLEPNLRKLSGIGSPSIEYALNFIAELRDYAAKRAEWQATAKGKRAEIASNYNDLFVAIGRRDGFTCQYCNTHHQLVIDHVIPIAKGGTNALENLQLLCCPCNSKKSDK